MPAENSGGSEHVHPPVLENDNPLSAVFYSGKLLIVILCL